MGAGGRGGSAKCDDGLVLYSSGAANAGSKGVTVLGSESDLSRVFSGELELISSTVSLKPWPVLPTAFPVELVIMVSVVSFPSVVVEPNVLSLPAASKSIALNDGRSSEMTEAKVSREDRFSITSWRIYTGRVPPDGIDALKFLPVSPMPNQGIKVVATYLTTLPFLLRTFNTLDPALPYHFFASSPVPKNAQLTNAHATTIHRPLSRDPSTNVPVHNTRGNCPTRP